MQAGLAALCLAALGAALAGSAELWIWSAALGPGLGAGFVLLSSSVVLALGLALAAPFVVLPAARWGRPELGASARLFFVLSVAAAALSVALFPGLREPYVAAGFALAGGLFAACSIGRSRRGASARRRVLDRLAFGLALSLVLAELGLRLAAALAHPPLLADETGARAWLEARRMRPGALHLGFPVNSRGDYDREPPAPGKSPLVVVIGDSFSTGAVSLPLHFTSVAERELGGVELYNMGAPGIDPPQYLELLRSEALPLRPDAIVVALFAGNDLEFDPPRSEPRSFLRSLVDREGCLLARFVTRATRLVAERARARAEEAGGGELQGSDVPAVDPRELFERFPWFGDPALERPTFSEAGFLKLEKERALAIARRNGAGEFACFPWLAAMQQAAGDVPLLVLLVPDEFQVEDALWEEVLETSRVELERDRPQVVVAAFCASRGLPLIDLLPPFRSLPPMADGRRHLYHLRDTHWNARGNEIAGKELARALRELLEREKG